MCFGLDIGLALPDNSQIAIELHAYVCMGFDRFAHSGSLRQDPWRALISREA